MHLIAAAVVVVVAIAAHMRPEEREEETSVVVELVVVLAVNNLVCLSEVRFDFSNSYQRIDQPASQPNYRPASELTACGGNISKPQMFGNWFV